jgi:hypothetical protein
VIEEKFTTKKIKKMINSVKYYVGVKKDANSRKTVSYSKSKLRNTARGESLSLGKKKSSVDNAKVYKFLRKDYKFDILRDPFNKKKYPQDEFKKIKKYLISKKESDQKRLGNGLVAMIKNYMDRQKLKVNKPSTAKQKHFNKFSIASRQLQKSIGWTVKKKK